MKDRLFWDAIWANLLKFSALISVLTLAGIFLMLLGNSAQAFSKISLPEFFSDSPWNPSAFSAPQFGLGAMLYSTLMVTTGAMLLAIPVGLGTALFLSEIATPKWRNIIKPAIEMLAAVPSVVIGFLGIVIIGPAISQGFSVTNGINALNGSILLAIMALPTLITVMEDAIHSVPSHYKEASYALGANRWETMVKVTIPACRSGILVAIMLGMGRALGETMTVLMATGNATAMPGGFFDPVRTLTATIAIEMGEVPFYTPHYYALFVCALVLFLITFLINLMVENLAARYRGKGQ
ncbi:MAG TPA: phosphate ABC transporter permease subunit PstC [Saprospirales bacterium]|nr:phosphate ABC transporter permease subunit PstC [Saprospirales bacterium]